MPGISRNGSGIRPSIADRRFFPEKAQTRRGHGSFSPAGPTVRAVSCAVRAVTRRGNLYFAYGANMAVRDMRSRCPGARFRGIAALDDYCFQINRLGFATVIPARGRTVFGALWRLTAGDLRALDAYEEVGRGIYERRLTVVRPIRGRRTSAIIYLAACAESGRPKTSYIWGIVESARKLGFPPSYRRELSRWSFGVPMAQRHSAQKLTAQRPAA